MDRQKNNIVAVLLKAVRRRSPRQLASIAYLRGRNHMTIRLCRLRYPQVEFGESVLITGKLIIRGDGKVKIGAFTEIHGVLDITSHGEVLIGTECTFHCYRHQINRIAAHGPSARVEIGTHCFFNGAHVSASTVIEFQPRCIVSDALIEDSDFHSIEINRWDPSAVGKSSPIHVGENVWIGSRSAVLKGVTIGSNSVVGMGTIVRKCVPANCVVIGNPQQIVKELNSTLPLGYESA